VTYCIGFYAFYEVVRHEGYSKISNQGPADFNIRGFGFSRKEFKEQFLNMLRSACIGIGIGILPGLGGNISNFVSLFGRKTASSAPGKIRNRHMDGIVASETATRDDRRRADSASVAGIPGDSCGAFVLRRVHAARRDAESDIVADGRRFDLFRSVFTDFRKLCVDGHPRVLRHTLFVPGWPQEVFLLS
jgi:TctA family transporter